MGEKERIDSPSTPREIYASIELSREDLIEAKKDRLLFGFLKNKKPGIQNIFGKVHVVKTNIVLERRSVAYCKWLNIITKKLVDNRFNNIIIITGNRIFYLDN